VDDVYQALAGAGVLPSLPHKDSTVITASADNVSATVSTESVSDVVRDKKPPPPAVAAKPSRHLDTSQLSFTIVSASVFLKL